MTGLTDIEPLATLLGGPDHYQAIENRSLRSFDRLPRKGLNAVRHILEGLGFVFGADLDDVFVAVTPPPGWALEATGHSYYHNIVDDKGRVRGQQFYKAAYYDRDAFFNLYPRYHVDLARPADWYKRGYPEQLPRKYKTVKKTVLVNQYDEIVHPAPGDLYAELYDADSLHIWGAHGDVRRVYRKEVESRVELPESKQPKRIKGVGYDARGAVFDRETGETVFETDPAYIACRDDGDEAYYASLKVEDGLRAAAVEWIKEAIPDYADVGRHWS